MCSLLHHHQVGMYGNIIYFLTCFVRIPTRNSVNPISKTTWFPVLLRVLFSKWQLLIMFPKRVRNTLSNLFLLSSVASKLLKGVISFIQTKLSLIWQWSFDFTALIDICHHAFYWCWCRKTKHKNVLFAVADSEIFAGVWHFFSCKMYK